MNDDGEMIDPDMLVDTEVDDDEDGPKSEW